MSHDLSIRQREGLLRGFDQSVNENIPRRSSTYNRDIGKANYNTSEYAQGKLLDVYDRMNKYLPHVIRAYNSMHKSTKQDSVHS